MTRKKTVRIWGTLPADKAKHMQEWANRLGLPQSQFFGMCAWSGIKTVLDVLEPERKQNANLRSDV